MSRGLPGIDGQRISKTSYDNSVAFFSQKAAASASFAVGDNAREDAEVSGSTALQDGRVMFLVAVFVMFLSFGDADIGSSTARSAA